MGRRIFLYGCYRRPGSRVSRISTDENFGDLLIYRALSSAFEARGHEVSDLFPDEASLLESLTPDDGLVVGGGGLIHPNLLSPAIRTCKARRAVYCIGANWNMMDHFSLTRPVVAQAKAVLEGIEFLAFRDRFTKDVLGLGGDVYPDPSLLHARQRPRVTTARRPVMVVHPLMTIPLSGERPVCFSSALRGITRAEDIRDLDQLWGVQQLRGAAYHAMLVGLIIGAKTQSLIWNIKQRAFLETFSKELRTSPWVAYPHMVTIAGCDTDALVARAQAGVDKLLDFME